MSVVTFSDEDTVVVPAETFFESWKALDGSEQHQVMKRLRKLVAQPNPEYYIYESPEGCDELQVIRSGDVHRVYCRLVMGIPAKNKQYNILYAFYIDDHTYDPWELSRYDDAAAMRLEEATSLSTIENVELYLKELDSMDLGDIDRILDK